MVFRDVFNCMMQSRYADACQDSRTVADKYALYDRYIDDIFGSSEAGALTADDYMEVLHSARAEYTSRDTLKRIIRLVRWTTEYGAAENIISVDPLRNRSREINNIIEARYFTPEERDLILKNVSQLRYPNLFRFIIYTGLAASQVCGIDNGSVFLSDAECYADRILSRSGGEGNAHWAHKTNGNIRVPLCRQAISVLRDEARRQAIYRQRAGDRWKNEYDLVFTDQWGSPVRREDIKEDAKMLARLTGIEHLTAGRLRYLHMEMLLDGMLQ